MTIRTPREIAAAIKAERPLRDITYTDADGTVWRFWAHGPSPRTAWLTDGRTFLGWDVRHARPRPDLVPQTVATLDSEHRARLARNAQWERESTLRDVLPVTADAWVTPLNQSYAHPRPRKDYGDHGHPEHP